MGTSQVPSRAEVVCTNTHYEPKDLSRFPENDREALELGLPFHFGSDGVGVDVAGLRNESPEVGVDFGMNQVHGW